MPTLETYLQYNDPNIVIWRTDEVGDEYVLRADSLPIINNQITLLEIPSFFHKVTISGFTEITQEILQKNKEILSNEFLVNYSNGIIQFHPSHEGKTLVCNYRGKGMILLAASRVYAMVQRSPDIVKTLQDIIDETLLKLKENNELITQVQTIMQEAIAATNTTNIATDNANLAKDGAIQATVEAQAATQDALDAAASTIMIYKNPVFTYADIGITYPNPENGWRVMVEDTGDIYRYDGIVENAWKLIDNYTGGSIPFASETTSGLLHVDDYSNFIVRSLVFSMPSILNIGVQNYIYQFPFGGEIVKAYAHCTVAGTLSPVEIQIQKISSIDFDVSGTWGSIFSTNIIIAPNENKGSTPVLSVVQVDKGDYFRINVLQLDNNIKGVNVQLDIKI